MASCKNQGSFTSKFVLNPNPSLMAKCIQTTNEIPTAWAAFRDGAEELPMCPSSQNDSSFHSEIVILLSTTSRVHLCLQGLRKIFRVVLIGILHQVKVSLYQYPIVGLKNQSDWINLTMVVLTTGGSIYNGMI